MVRPHHLVPTFMIRIGGMRPSLEGEQEGQVANPIDMMPWLEDCPQEVHAADIPLADIDDELAEMRGFAHAVIGVFGIFEGEGFVDHRLELVQGDGLVHVRKHRS